MLDWKKHKLESTLPGEIPITSDMQMTPICVSESFSIGWQMLHWASEEEMATHSRVLAWRIPWAEESGRLESLVLSC